MSTQQALTNPDLPPFVLLADPQAYQPCNVDLMEDAEARNYWVDFFCEHIDTILQLGIDSSEDKIEAQSRASACAIELRRHLRHFQSRPRDFNGVTLLLMDVWRDRHLREHGFSDCFAEQKLRENMKFLPEQADVHLMLESIRDDDVLQFAIECVFAGNIFDMGAKATAAQFKDKSPDFWETKSNLKDRPWRIDDLDALQKRFEANMWKKIVIFGDNAGSDFWLGIVPLARMLSLRGAKVIIALNERPSLNDMTIHDARQLWPVVEETGTLDDCDITLVSTGTGEPLIDLRGVSPELNFAAEGADLVILEGMGRGVESNLDANLVCDRLNLAMLKDELIARHIGGELYDCVCKFVAKR